MADNNGSCGRTKNDGVKFAMYAGFFAALASVFAKIAFSRKLVSNLLCGEGEYFRPIFYGMFTCEKVSCCLDRNCLCTQSPYKLTLKKYWVTRKVEK